MGRRKHEQTRGEKAPRMWDSTGQPADGRGGAYGLPPSYCPHGDGLHEAAGSVTARLGAPGPRNTEHFQVKTLKKEEKKYRVGHFAYWALHTHAQHGVRSTAGAELVHTLPNTTPITKKHKNMPLASLKVWSGSSLANAVCLPRAYLINVAVLPSGSPGQHLAAPIRTQHRMAGTSQHPITIVAKQSAAHGEQQP